MAVHISGAVLASMFYDTAESVGDQIGFLLGEVVNHITDTISDSQINNSEVETRIYIYGHMPCPRDQKFYDNRGHILESQVLSLLKDKHKNIIGWYSFRRNSSLRPSYRERLLHQNLAQAVSDEPLADFMFLLCSSKATTNMSTHSFDHGFLRLTESGFKKVSMNVINLGDTTHAEYRLHPTHTVSQSRGAYSHIIRTHEQEYLDSRGQVDVTKIDTLSSSLYKQLQDLSVAVLDSELTVSSLETEVTTMRKQLRLKEIEKLQQQKRSVQSARDRGRSALDQQKTDHSHPMDDGSSDAQKLGNTHRKQPSVDDLLSMDFIDDDPSEVKGQSVVSAEPVSQTVDSVSQNISTSKPKSNSSNIESQANSIEKNQSHNPSQKLPEVAVVQRPDRPLKNDSNAESIELKTQSKESSKPEDPFSFVSSMMAQSKPEESINKQISMSGSMAVPKGQEIKLPRGKAGSPPVTMDTGEQKGTSVAKDFKEMKRLRSSRENNAAVAAAAALAGSNIRGERSRGKKGNVKSEGHSNTNRENSHEDKVVEDDIDTVSGARSKSGVLPGATNSATRCGQELSKNKMSEKSSENPNSPDSGSFEEMEVSSSPVY